MKTLSIVSLFFTITISSALAQLSGYTDIIQPGKYDIKLNSTNISTVSCIITVVKYSPQMLHTAYWGVIFEDTTWTVIKSIRFNVKGKEFEAPLSSYSDLAEPDRAMIQKVGKHYRFLMDGSDAAFGYNVTIDFDDWHVIERTVHNGEFPSSSWEKTIYHADTTSTEN